MLEYKRILEQQLEIDRTAFSKRMIELIEEWGRVKITNYIPRVNGWREATIDGVKGVIEITIRPSKNGDVLEVVSKDRHMYTLDVSIPYKESIKECHNKVQLGEYLLDMCESYINFPNLIR